MPRRSPAYVSCALMALLAPLACHGVWPANCLAADTAAYPIWSIDRYLNITRTQAPEPGAPARLDGLEIALAQGEFRDAVFMVGPADRDLRLEVKVVAAPDVPVELLETIYLKNRKGGETGDAARPLRGPLEVPAGQSRQIYLRADTRFSPVPAGVYPLAIELRQAGGGSPRRIQGKVRVWDFALPGHDVLPNNCWAQFEDSSFKTGELNAAAVRDMKANGVNVVFIHGMETPRPRNLSAGGQVTGGFDDSLLRARVKPIVDVWRGEPGEGRLRFIITLAGMYDFGHPEAGLSVMGEGWKTAFAAWLKHLRQTLRGLGVGDSDWMLTFADETPYKDVLRTEVPVAELARRIDPGMLLFSDCSLDNQPKGYGTIIEDSEGCRRFFDAFDVFQPHLYYGFLGTSPQFSEWFLSNARQRGKQVWSYQCRTDLGAILPPMAAGGNSYFEENNLYEYYRVYGWTTLKYGFDGIGLWTYCAQVSGQKDWTCHLVYALDGQLVHSRRFDMYLEGIDDYRYLWLLRKLGREAQAEVRVEKLIGDAVSDITRHPRDSSRCEHWRKEIAGTLLKLMSRGQ